MSFGLIYLGGFILGGTVVLVAAESKRIRLRIIAVVIGVVLVAAVAAFGLTYRDEFCDDYTGCRLVAGPAFFTYTAVVPGMVAALVVTALSRRSKRTARSPNRGSGPDTASGRSSPPPR